MNKTDDICIKSLSQILGLEIPENSTFEFVITSSEESEIEKSGQTNVFKGRVTFADGKQIDRRRLVPDIKILTGVKKDAWPG
ncbi:hypothetical protein [Vibrio hangzhouensis]|uniref:hypothetical protein n=1 Tax=Vibrio hangzhouensis TaxID=462991 RepID=UPI001C95FB66|nr:hypothetical protein [Vibrio hangzhouensis]MBY6197724.1 hypothetical protein [Vibrio hangzhouensis]